MIVVVKSIILIIITIEIILLIIVVLVIVKIGILILDGENNSIITNNVVNRSIGENHGNISNCLNNKYINIY